MYASLVHELLETAASRFPGNIAVSDGDGAWTYRELSQHSQRAAGWLWRLGVRPGDRVVLVLSGSRDFAAVLYGALRIGAAAVPVNPATGAFHLRWMLHDAAPRVVVTSAGDVPAVREVSTAPVYGTAQMDTGAPPEPHGAATALARPDAIALLMYTSGSTAMPRAVVCPHERVCFAVDAIAARLGYRPDDVVFCRPPLSFDYGLYQLLLSARAGAHLVLRPRATDAALLREVRECGATVLPVVPTLATILGRLAARDDRPTTVRLVTNTGAALTSGHATALRHAFPNAAIVPMYGLTECKRATIAEPDEDRRHPGTVGRPLDGTEIVVTDPAGRPLEPTMVGEIRVRGPHVMAGYWRCPEATAARFDDLHGPHRTLRTGDHGYLDAAGRLYFVGRHDDVFKRKSVRTSVQEIEAAVLDIPGIEAAAVPRPEPDGELVVWVTGSVTPTEVLAGLARRIERAKVPDRCEVVPALPATVNGKVDKRALRELAEGAR